jgi:P pilus assembly chaperone PapD
MKRFRSLRSSVVSAALIALALTLAAVPAAAVTVSPTALFIDSRSPSATLTLYNGGTVAEELEVSFAFGYPVSDAQGRVTVDLVDTAAAGEPSLVPYLRAFPRRLTLAPGQRQTLRVLVQAPGTLAAGEYWGRVMVRARGGQPPIEQTQGNVRMQLSVETVVATAVLFRKGAVDTGVRLVSATAELARDSVRATFDVERTGSAVWLGRVSAQLVGPDGRVVGETGDAVALYRSLRLRFVLPLPAGAPRSGYTVRYVLDNERPDLPSPGHVTAPPINGTTPVR